MNQSKLNEIEKVIGVEFSDKNLLQRVFTHSSKLNEGALSCNENLEFLGDSILNYIISKRIFELFQDVRNEGEMSKLRASLVSSASLSKMSRRLGISPFLNLSSSVSCHDNYDSKIYADLYEALVAGIFFEKGFSFAEEYVLGHFEGTFTDTKLFDVIKSDVKSSLQELVQKNKLGEIEYRMMKREGLDHDPIFFFEVYIGEKCFGKGKGASKKIAETECAKKALVLLQNVGGKKD